MTKILTADIVDGLEEREIIVDPKTGIELVVEHFDYRYRKGTVILTTRDTVNIKESHFDNDYSNYKWKYLRNSTFWAIMTKETLKECLRTGNYTVE